MVRRLILVLTIAPLLTSGIVRTYAWLVILGRRGVVNMALLDLGLIDQPLRIMNTHWAVLIGMVQIHLPMMILPLIAVMSRHDRRLDEASANLGASRLGTLRHVILPLSAPGIGTGCALVFTLSYTTFVVPQLLGGGNYLNAATMIYEQVVYSLEWSKGAVTAMILMVTCLIVLVAIALAHQPLHPLDEGTRRMSRAGIAAHRRQAGHRADRPRRDRRARDPRGALGHRGDHLLRHPRLHQLPAGGLHARLVPAAVRAARAGRGDVEQPQGRASS